MDEALSRTFNLGGGRLRGLSENVRRAFMLGAPLEPVAPVEGEEPPRTDVLPFEQYRQWRADFPELTPLRTEWSIWSQQLKLAGQIDSLFWNPVTGEILMVREWS